MNEARHRPKRRSLSRMPRLRKRSEFLTAASGRRVHSSRMTVQIYERAETAAQEPADLSAVSGPRFGLTVTKKTANAVGRNRIRRRLRAVLRDLRPVWPDADVDFVIVGRAGLLTAPMDVIASDLKRAFSSPPRQGNRQGRSDRASYRKRGKDAARPPGTTQRNPTDHP